MLETGYQSKIIKGIESIGGVAINGTYSVSGEADLQCGWPHTDTESRDRKYPDNIKHNLVVMHGSVVLDELDEEFTTLLHLAVEVKTEEDYHRVMKCINSDYSLNGKTGLKKHEPMQMAKIQRNRARGGMALVAYSFEQVKEYVDGIIESKNRRTQRL